MSRFNNKLARGGEPCFGRDKVNRGNWLLGSVTCGRTGTTDTLKDVEIVMTATKLVSKDFYNVRFNDRELEANQSAFSVYRDMITCNVVACCKEPPYSKSEIYSTKLAN